VVCQIESIYWQGVGPQKRGWAVDSWYPGCEWLTLCCHGYHCCCIHCEVCTKAQTVEHQEWLLWSPGVFSVRDKLRQKKQLITEHIVQKVFCFRQVMRLWSRLDSPLELSIWWLDLLDVIIHTKEYSVWAQVKAGHGTSVCVWVDGWKGGTGSVSLAFSLWLYRALYELNFFMKRICYPRDKKFVCWSKERLFILIYEQPVLAWMHVEKHPWIFILCLMQQGHLLLVNNQLDAQFFFLICLFQFSTCFEQTHADHQENQLYQYYIWDASLCVRDHLVGTSGRNSFLPDLHTRWSPTSIVFIQLILLMMSTRFLETCRELK
jgi:hypothetical protein